MCYGFFWPHVCIVYACILGLVRYYVLIISSEEGSEFRYRNVVIDIFSRQRWQMSGIILQSFTRNEELHGLVNMKHITNYLYAREVSLILTSI